MNFESFFFRAGEKLQKSLKPAPLLRKVDFCFAPVKNAQTAKKRKNGKNWGEQFPPILKAGGTRFSQKTKHFIIKAVCVKHKAGRIFPPNRPTNPPTNALELPQKSCMILMIFVVKSGRSPLYRAEDSADRLFPILRPIKSIT